MRFAFQINWDDLSLYDLIINPEKMGSQVSAQLIIDAARSDEVKECTQSALEAMERLSLKKKVEAELSRKDFFLPGLNVEVTENGVVHIYGFTFSENEKQKLVKTVLAVPDVIKFEDNIAVMPRT